MAFKLSISKFADIFEDLPDGTIIEFIKENDDPIKMEIVDRKTDSYKITYRGGSILNNIPIQYQYFEDTIKIKVDGKDITGEVS